MTEFLPVSSSGHLVFFQSVFGFKEPHVFFDVVLHLGTLLAVVVFFRTDLSNILQGTRQGLKARKMGQDGIRLLIWIIIATIPTGLMGILFKDWFESLFTRPKIVGGMLLTTGLILWFTRYVKRDGRLLEKMGWVDALLIGIVQGIAIIPGISRSGSTISTGLFCGLDRELAGKFSFLLSIPAILGATLLELRGIESPTEVCMHLIGMAIAFLVGLLSLKFLMRIVRRGRLFTFAYYCWPVGILMILLAN